MTLERDPETILAAWLDEGPTDLPATTRRAIAASLPTTRQHRRSWAPWRFTSMPTPVRLAAAAVIGVLLVGVIYLNLPGGNDVGGPSTPTVPRYESRYHGYSIDIPDDWGILPATEPWTTLQPSSVAPFMDRLRGRDALLVATSAPLGGRSADEWKAAYAEQFGLDGIGTCDVLPADWPSINIGGEDGFLVGNNCPGDLSVAEGDVFFEAVTFVDGRVYLFWLQGLVDRPGFDALLETVTFHPESAIDPSPTT